MHAKDRGAVVYRHLLAVFPCSPLLRAGSPRARLERCGNLGGFWLRVVKDYLTTDNPQIDAPSLIKDIVYGDFFSILMN